MKKNKPFGELFYRSLKKTLLIMRIAIILMILGILQARANDAYSQKTRLSLNFSETELVTVLDKIETESEFFFLYNEKLLNTYRKVSIKANDQLISVILDDLFAGTDVKYTIIDRKIILAPDYLSNETDETANLQQQVVTGKVTDIQTGESMPGVNIVVKGTSIGAITDIAGNYSISVTDRNATLVFSFIGYIAQDVALGGKTTLNVSMVSDVEQLEEVVVIGYGTTSQKKLTTSIGRLKAEQLTDLPINNIADAFSGQISGILAEKGSGTPGALPVIRIRGYGSINAGSEPLYVIDGIMASSREFSLLNPNSIASIDILKDAAAGAIYGSRAGNGVIQVTTKKGKYGEAKFSFNAIIGLQEVTNKVDVLDSDQWLSFVKEAYANDGKPLPDFYNRDASNFANTNWQDEIFRVSPFQNYQLSATGSSGKIQYYIAANVLDNEGIIKTTYSKTYSSTGSFDIQLNDKLKVGLTYNASFTKERVNNSISGFGHSGGGYGISGGIIQQALWFSPIIPVHTANGDYGQYTQGEFAPYFVAGYANPVANLNETFDIYSKNNAMGRIYLNYELIKGLTFNPSFSGTVYSYFRDWHVSPYLSGSGSPFANFSNPVYEKISAAQENGMSNSWTAEAYMNYTRTFANDHDFDLIVGYSMQYNGSRLTSARSSINDRGASNAANPIDAFDNYYRPNIYGAAMVLGSGAFGENTFESVFSRLHYTLKDKYIFMGSIRRDGSSKFAPAERFGIFPALSGAWRISQESFMENIFWIDDFKFRLSYGVSGNDQIGNYAWMGTVNYSNLYTYGDPSTGGGGTGKALIPSTIENNHLKWETNEQTDFGADISIFDNRINLTADYFIRKTKDMLLYRSLPLENGITGSFLDNVGSMVNKGIELSLNTVNVKTSDFLWSTNFIFTKISNIVDKVFTSTGEIRYGTGLPGAGAIRIIEDHPLFEIYSWKVIGNFETQEQLTTYPGFNNPKLGDPMVEDYNNDKKINDDDMQPMGQVLPDFTYGINSKLTFRNLDLSIILDGNQGASKVIVAVRQAALMRTAENTLQIFYDDRYRPGESGHGLAFPTTGYSGPRHSNVSYFIQNASFTRIKNVMLGYNFSENICSKIKVNAFRATLGIQNLYTFTKYPLYNPEANTNAGAAGTAQFGVDNGEYPLSRIYTFGVNLTF